MTVGTSWSLIDHTEQIAQLAEAEADRAAELQRATDLHCQEELQLRRVARGRDTFKALAGQVAQQATAAPAPAAQQASMAAMFGDGGVRCQQALMQLIPASVSVLSFVDPVKRLNLAQTVLHLNAGCLPIGRQHP